MTPNELRRALRDLTLESLGARALATAPLPAGVRALDLWSNGRHGSVLFWLDRELGLWPFDHAVLHHEDAERLPDGEWRSTNGGAQGTYEPGQILADQPSGLQKLGGGSHDPVRLTVGIASADVAAIRLRDDHGARERPAGAHGSFLLGITFQEPITYAVAIGREGQASRSCSELSADGCGPTGSTSRLSRSRPWTRT
jgi:hypothetical protein